MYKKEKETYTHSIPAVPTYCINVAIIIVQKNIYLFATWTLIFKTADRPPSKVYTKLGHSLGLVRNIDSGISPILPLNFTRGQKVGNLVSIFDHGHV